MAKAAEFKGVRAELNERVAAIIAKGAFVPPVPVAPGFVLVAVQSRVGPATDEIKAFYTLLVSLENECHEREAAFKGLSSDEYAEGMPLRRDHYTLTMLASMVRDALWFEVRHTFPDLAHDLTMFIDSDWSVGDKRGFNYESMRPNFRFSLTDHQEMLRDLYD